MLIVPHSPIQCWNITEEYYAHCTNSNVFLDIGPGAGERRKKKRQKVDNRSKKLDNTSCCSGNKPVLVINPCSPTPIEKLQLKYFHTPVFLPSSLLGRTQRIAKLEPILTLTCLKTNNVPSSHKMDE